MTTPGSRGICTLGQEARVTSKEWVLDSGDIKDIDNGHEEDMTEEDIEIVDEAFRECLQVLDVVLAAPRNGSAFNAYFKDHRYHNSIFEKYQHVRGIIRQVVSQSSEAPVMKRLRIIKSYLNDPRLDCQAMSYSGDHHREIYLCKHWWDSGRLISSFCDVDPEENAHFLEHAVQASKSMVLMHEATHLSDFLEHQDWVAGTKCKQAIHHSKDRSFIGDAQPARFARKKSKSDAEIVDQYTYWAKGKKQCYGVLGLHEAVTFVKHVVDDMSREDWAHYFCNAEDRCAKCKMHDVPPPSTEEQFRST